MPASANSYTTDVPVIYVDRARTNSGKIRADNLLIFPHTLLVRDFGTNSSPLNARVFALINDIAELQENWDMEGSPALDKGVVRYTKAIMNRISTSGQKIFNVTPGSNSEIMINVRNGKRSLELIIYPSKKKFVKFDGQERPMQGEFSHELLPQLIAWVNAL